MEKDETVYHTLGGGCLNIIPRGHLELLEWAKICLKHTVICSYWNTNMATLSKWSVV
jgi:hypothetical protein